MSDPIRAALERFIALADEDLLCPGNPAETDWGAVKSVLAEARAALAEQQSDGPAVLESREPDSVASNPSDKELVETGMKAVENYRYATELPYFLSEDSSEYEPFMMILRAVLARWGHQPAPPAEGEVGELVAVPVSDETWRDGWLNSDGECWWCPPKGPAYWQMANPAMVYGGWLLPAHALPLPQGEVK